MISKENKIHFLDAITCIDSVLRVIQTFGYSRAIRMINTHVTLNTAFGRQYAACIFFDKRNTVLISIRFLACICCERLNTNLGNRAGIIEINVSVVDQFTIQLLIKGNHRYC